MSGARAGWFLAAAVALGCAHSTTWPEGEPRAAPPPVLEVDGRLAVGTAHGAVLAPGAVEGQVVGLTRASGDDLPQGSLVLRRADGTSVRVRYALPGGVDLPVRAGQNVRLVWDRLLDAQGRDAVRWARLFDASSRLLAELGVAVRFGALPLDGAGLRLVPTGKSAWLESLRYRGVCDVVVSHEWLRARAVGDAPPPVAGLLRPGQRAKVHTPSFDGTLVVGDAIRLIRHTCTEPPPLEAVYAVVVRSP